MSDRLIAIAITLLVPEVHTPVRNTPRTEHKSLNDAAHIAGVDRQRLLSFTLSAVFWNGLQPELKLLARSNRYLTWIQIGFLFFVSILPFATRLLAEFIDFRKVLLCYRLNILLLGAMLYAS